MSWTDENIAECKRLHEAGYSASQIAAQLCIGVTRNAVIGIIHRKGWTRSGRKVTDTGQKIVKLRQVRGVYKRREAKPNPHNNAPSTKSQRAAGQRAYLEAVEATDLPSDQSPFACTLIDLQSGMCRWPMGDPQLSDFRYCGAKAFTERSYCARHCAIAYAPPRQRMNISEEERQRRVRQARMNNELRKSFNVV